MGSSRPLLSAAAGNAAQECEDALRSELHAAGCAKDGAGAGWAAQATCGYLGAWVVVNTLNLQVWNNYDLNNSREKCCPNLHVFRNGSEVRQPSINPCELLIRPSAQAVNRNSKPRLSFLTWSWYQRLEGWAEVVEWPCKEVQARSSLDYPECALMLHTSRGRSCLSVYMYIHMFMSTRIYIYIS